MRCGVWWVPSTLGSPWSFRLNLFVCRRATRCMREVVAPHTHTQTHALACSCSTATTAHNLVVCALLCDDAPTWMCCVSLPLGLGEIVTLPLVLWWRGADESCGSFMCVIINSRSSQHQHPTPTPSALCIWCREAAFMRGRSPPACYVYLVVRAGVVAGAVAHAACVCVCPHSNGSSEISQI